MMPIAQLGTEKVSFNALVMELACVILPMPKDAITVKNAKNQPTAQCFVFNGFFHGIHGAAGHFPVGIDAAVFDGQHAFAEFGCETEAGGYPHPYKRTRAAGYHGGGHTYDIPGADGSCSFAGFFAGFFAQCAL